MRYAVPDVPSGRWQQSELEIEKSRFITWIRHAAASTDLEAMLAEARRIHPNASHHCSAFIAGPPGEQNAIGFSDDGEPGGTAGRPMFQVLEGAEIGRIGCVVTRYFGGTKLGTGGLARAYSRAVAEGLEALPRREVVERTSLHLRIDFAGEAEARAWLAEQEMPIEQAGYDADGVKLTVGWPDDTPVNLSALETRLRGRLTVLEE